MSYHQPPKNLDTLPKRLSWAINDIIRRNRLSNKKLAAILEVDKNTIANYRNMHTSPRSAILKKIADRFQLNLQWLHTNEGKPYPESDSSKRARPKPSAADVAGISSKDEAETVVSDKAERPEAGTQQAAYGETRGFGGHEVWDSGIQFDRAERMRLSESLAMAARVLESGTDHARMLALMILYMNRALQMDEGFRDEASLDR